MVDSTVRQKVVVHLRGKTLKYRKNNVNKASHSISICILPTIVPNYRIPLYERLIQDRRFSTIIYSQKELPGYNVKYSHELIKANVRIVEYFYFKPFNLCFQILPIKEILTHDVIIVNGNPRVISDMLVGVLGLLLKKKIILWGMVKSYKANRLNEVIRLWWYKRFKNIFVYNDYEVSTLRKEGFITHNIVGMNNGLDVKAIKKIVEKLSIEKIIEHKIQLGLKDKKIILSCCRLDPKNNISLILDALPMVLEVHPDAHLLLIGDGPDRSTLATKVSQFKIEENVTFLGEIYEEKMLAPNFMCAKALVHPSSIGLTLLHAFCYSLTVITHDRPHLHNPEIAALNNLVTGLTFEYGNSYDLAAKMIFILDNEDVAVQIGKNANELAERKYNSDVMASRLTEIIYSAYYNE